MGVGNPFMSECPFSLLGLSVTPFLSQEMVLSSYRKGMSLFHPDRAKSDQEHQIFLQKSTDVTNAYRLLKDPYKRGLCLLEKAGVPIEEGTTSTNSDLLEWAFSCQEAFQEGSFSEEDLFEKRQVLYESFSKAYHESDFIKAKESLERYRYLSRLLGDTF